MNRAKLSVVILNWNNVADTSGCLKRLSQWAGLKPTVWVVDNASHDGSGAVIAESFPTIHLIQSTENLGFAGGNNLAFRQILAAEPTSDQTDSAGHYVLLLNNDAVIEEPDVQQLIKTLEQNPELGVVGPLFVDLNTPEIITSGGGRDLARYINSHLNGSQLKPAWLEAKRPYPVDYVSGTVALFRVELLRTVGLFDEAYFFSGEMADWCERLKIKGKSCGIMPLARAYHHTDRAGSRRSRLYAYYILRNRFLFIRKFRSGQQVPFFTFWIGYGLAFMIKAGLGGQWSTMRAVGLALFDGLLGHYGGQNERIGEQ